jgi:hypothetical protein
MKKTIEFNIAVITFISIWFTILFDPTSLAIGSNFVTIPNFMIGIAEVFGNLIWIFGLLLFIASIFFIYLIFNEDAIEKAVRKAVKEKIKEGDYNITPHTIININGTLMFKPRNWWNKILLVVAVVGSLIAIGSGFWFTGTAWLLVIISLQVYRKIGIKISEDVIKEEYEKMKNE